MFEIEIRDDEIVYLSGRLDASQVPKAEEILATLNRSFVADLSGLNYISSAGIGLLMKTYKRLHDTGHAIRLVNLTQHVRNVFHYAGLESIFMIE